MTEPKFTPGPWHYDKDNHAIFNNNSLFICFAPLNNEDDIHLIASAPSLYKALEYVLKCWDDDRGLLIDDSMEKARAALAKARGEG